MAKGLDIIDAIGILSDFALEYFNGEDFQGVGAYASEENRMAMVAFKSGGKGYKLTLEEVDEEGEEND